jgi:hypothetical protein
MYSNSNSFIFAETKLVREMAKNWDAESMVCLPPSFI